MARDTGKGDLAALRKRAAELEAAVSSGGARAYDDKRFRIVAEQTGQLIYDYDTGTGRIEWAGAIERLTGYTEAEFADVDISAWEELIHPDDRERALALLDQAMKRVDRYAVEYRFRRKDGSYINVEDRGLFLPDDDGAAVRMLGTMSNVTQRKQLEAQVHHRQKLESLGVLAGGIAHDFNNLLTTILGNADIAAHQVPANSPLRKQLDAIAVAGRRAGDLCRQLLAYSGKTTSIIGPVDLNHVFAEMKELLAVSVSTSTRLDLELSEKPALVMGSAAQLRQVAMNLIMNAAEALGDEGGRVVVRTSTDYFDAKQLLAVHGETALRAGQYCVLSVSDDGRGMDRATQQRIFDPFFTTKFTGRGLGLAAVIGIVSSHNGGILLDSTPGRGTTFRILLPVAAEPVAADEADSDVAQVALGSTILIVDDEETVRQVAEAILEDSGYKTVVARNGHDALDVFSQRPDAFTCVMLDLVMPGLGGEQVMNKMRELRPDLPILLCSGYGELSLKNPLAAGSPTAFLQKPYTVVDLLRSIQRLVANRA